MSDSRWVRVIAGLLSMTAMAGARPARVFAQDGGKVAYDQMLERYLAAARRLPAPEQMWMTDLMRDLTARRVNDLVTIRVIENATAVGRADSSVGKASNAQVGLPGKLGEWTGKALPASSDTKFNGSGSTSRTTELSAALTARVTEVLPNGDLVIEGIRELGVNGDRQVIVLTGVIRASDIQPTNVIDSPRIGQLQIRSLSQGLIKDSLSPGWLVRMLNKIF